MRIADPRLLFFLTALMVGCQSGSSVHPLADRDEVAKLAIAQYVARGEEAIPELRELSESEDLLVKARAREALGKITGQWGSSENGIQWKRSVEDAINPERPLVVLHLFGNFDEEFC